MLEGEKVKLAMTTWGWEQQAKVSLLRAHDFLFGGVNRVDTQFQKVLFESPCFRLSLPEKDYFRLLNFHYELLVTVVGAHKENVASIRQGRRRNIRDDSVSWRGCIRLSWWTYLDGLVELHSGTKRIKSNWCYLSQALMLRLYVTGFCPAHLSPERAYTALNFLLEYLTLFLFFVILWVLRSIGTCFVIEFRRISFRASIWVNILRITTVDKAEIAVIETLH